MQSLHSNRKANAVIDGILLIIFLFITAIGVVITYSWFDQINTDLQNDTDFYSGAKNVTQTYTDIYPSLWDNAFLTAWILLTIGLFISVVFLDTHPVFFFINVIMLISLYSIAIVMANSYDDFISDAEISSYASQFPFITWVNGHMVEITIVTTACMLIALFIKLRQS